MGPAEAADLAGEVVERAALGRFLREQLGEEAAEIELTRFPDGHSNLTFLVRLRGRELVLRRPPFGADESTHDVRREFAFLSRIAAVYPRAPRPVLLCEDESVLGARFYLMERIPGLVLRRTPPPGTGLGPERVRRLCEDVVEALVELHALRRGDGEEPFAMRRVDDLAGAIAAWKRRYAAARGDPVPEMEELASWLETHAPAPSAATFVHNDFKYDNLVLDPRDAARVAGVLDWEMAGVGDPLGDLGTALAYWVEDGDPVPLKVLRVGPTSLPGSYTRRELAERYSFRSGRDLSDVVFYYCLGLYRTAVLFQEIYDRFRRGLMPDRRFAKLLLGVPVLAGQALRSAARGQL